MLYLWALADGSWKWLASSHGTFEQIVCWQHASNLQQLQEQIAVHHTSKAIMYFPTGQAQIFNRSLSKQQYKQLGSEGVRTIAEEFSLNTLEDLVVKTRFDSREQKLYIVAITHETRLQYQHLNQLLSVDIVGLLPDILLIEGEGDLLYSDEVTSLFKRGPFEGFDAGTFDVLLTRLTPPTTQLTLLGSAVQQRETYEQMYPEIMLVMQPDYVPQARLEHQMHAYNLLADAQQTEIPLYWKIVAAVALLAIAVQIVFQTVSLYQNSQLTTALRAQNESYFRQLFPGEPIVAEMDLDRRIRAHLPSTVSPETSALQLLTVIAPILTTHRVYIQSFQAQANRVEMMVLADNAEQLEKINTDLRQSGFRSQMNSNQTTTTRQMQAHLNLEYQN